MEAFAEVLDKLDQEIKPGDFIAYRADGIGLARVIYIKLGRLWLNSDYRLVKMKIGYVGHSWATSTDDGYTIKTKVLKDPSSVIVLDQRRYQTGS